MLEKKLLAVKKKYISVQDMSHKRALSFVYFDQFDVRGISRTFSGIATWRKEIPERTSVVWLVYYTVHSVK